ncbi:MAG: peptide deformylase [Chlamydiae bacterium]|nr:peptide deformylase [Chlamydiota bacterium]
MKLPIIYYGHPVLRKKCEPIREITEDIKQLVADMIETMDASDGIGIAAPQVGRAIRLFVLRNYVETADGEYTLSPPKAYINPKLLNPSLELVEDVEGCLSMPGIRAKVKRPSSITVQATDLDGNEFCEHLEGYNARVRMHENDHINGVLFIDRLDSISRKKIEASLKEIKKKYSE